MVRRESASSRPAVAAWAVAAIVVFVIVDAALVWWALASGRPETGSPQGELLPTLPPAPTGTDEPGAPTPTPFAPVAKPGVMLAALDANTAYRGQTGSCPGSPASFEVTTDGGATWTAGNTEGLTDLQSVEPSEGGIVTMVARDAACLIGRYRTFVQGDDWEPTGEVEPAWYVDGDAVVGPGGSTTPCATGLVQAAGASPTSAAVLCASGQVLVTSDVGETWPTSPTGTGVVSIAAGPAGYVVAVTGDGCRGIRIVTIDPSGGSATAPGACVDADAAPGTVAVAGASDGTIWAWTGGVLARSSDGGATW